LRLCQGFFWKDVTDETNAYLAQFGGHHSIRRLEALLDLKTALIKKHRQAEESIEDMLNL
jgi:hypothetical protein